MAEKGKLVWSIAVDTKDLAKGLKVAKKNVDKFGKETSKKDVKLNVKANMSGLKDVSSKIGKLDGSKINVKAQVNDGDLKSADSKISKLNGRAANVKVNVDDSDIASAESRISKLSGGGGMSAGITSAIAGIGAGAGLFGLVRGTADLDTNVRKIGTVYGDFADKDLKNVRAQVIKTSREIGISTADLSQGIYDALSSGIPKENVFDFVKTASRTAIAGSTDLASVVRVLTGTVNAYAGMNLSAADASDILTKAVNIGVFEMSDLVQQMADITPIASAMRVPLSDATGWLAKLTKNGTPVAQAATQIKQAMAELSDSTSKAGKNFKKVSGKTFPAYIKAGGDIEGAMKLMEKQAKKLGLQNSEMFGSIEAGQAVMGVTGDNMKDFTDVLDGMRDSAGATTTAYDIMDEGVQRKITRSWNKFKTALADVFVAISPAVEKGIKLLSGIFEKVKTGLMWFVDHKTLMVTTFAVLGGVLTAFFLSWAASATAAGLATLAATWPLILIGGLIGGFIAGIVLLYKKNEWFRNFVDESWKKIKEIIKNAWETTIKPALENLKKAWDNLVKTVKDFNKEHPAFADNLKLIAKLFGAIILTGFSGFLMGLGVAANIVATTLDGIAKALDYISKAMKIVSSEWKKLKGAFGMGEGEKGVGSSVSHAVDRYLNSYSNADKNYSGRKASGGFMQSKSATLVGERGPEIIFPTHSGFVATAKQTEALMGGGSNSSNVYLKVDVSGVTAMTRPQAKEFGSFIIDAVNDDLRKRGTAIIGDGYVKSAS